MQTTFRVSILCIYSFFSLLAKPNHSSNRSNRKNQKKICKPFVYIVLFRMLECKHYFYDAHKSEHTVHFALIQFRNFSLSSNHIINRLDLYVTCIRRIVLYCIFIYENKREAKNANQYEYEIELNIMFDISNEISIDISLYVNQ